MSSIEGEKGEEVKLTIAKQKSVIDLDELQLKLTNLQLSKMENEEEKEANCQEEAIKPEVELKEEVAEEAEVLIKKKKSEAEQQQQLTEHQNNEKKSMAESKRVEEGEEVVLPSTSASLREEFGAKNSKNPNKPMAGNKSMSLSRGEEGCPSTSRMSSSTSGNNSVQEDDESLTDDGHSISLSNAVTASPLPVSEANSEEKIDVGMGSSIECSEESEEDDELKPLAIDNHVIACHRSDLTDKGNTLTLSESNLEKFHLQQQLPSTSTRALENIYLHPNFHYENQDPGNKTATNAKESSAVNELDEESLEPMTIVPSNSPVESVHQTFLTIGKKSSSSDTKEAVVVGKEKELEKANSVVSQNSNRSEEGDEKAEAGESLVNEIDNLSAELIPDNELATQIVEAVEYYFSNECILKDAFLLKHVRRNKEGFVSLKLVSSFKRVRQLTKDWRVVGYAVRSKSSKIVVNDNGTKVKRLDALPVFDETMPSRTVVASDLPLEKMTIEKVSEIFAKCGDIALIRLLKPGMTIPVDVRQFMNKHPEMQQKECALVEYVDSASARSALQLEGSFKVLEMVAPKKKTGKKALAQLISGAGAGVGQLHSPHQFHDQMPYERLRGSSFSGVSNTLPGNDLRHKLKRYNSDVYSRVYGAQKQQMQYLDQIDPSEMAESMNMAYQHQLQNASGRSFHPRRGSVGIVHEANANPYNGSRRFSNTNLMNSYHHQPHSFINEEELPPAPLQQRRYSNVPEEISAAKNSGQLSSSAPLPYMEMSRRPSVGMGGNNFTESMMMMARRDSNCSADRSPPMTRRLTPPEYVTGDERMFRKSSQTSSLGSGERRFSTASMHYEGEGSSYGFQQRRLSSEYNALERKPMEGHLAYENSGQQFIGGEPPQTQLFHQPRRYSNNFYVGNAAKLAMYERRISTDSGYDRRCSFGSEYENSPRSRTGSFLINEPTTPRSRTGSFIGQYDSPPRSRTGSFLDGSGAQRSRSGSFAQRQAETLVRTPLGPDGSKGFGSRLRKAMETAQAVN